MDMTHRLQEAAINYVKQKKKDNTQLDCNCHGSYTFCMVSSSPRAEIENSCLSLVT